MKRDLEHGLGDDFDTVTGRNPGDGRSDRLSLALAAADIQPAKSVIAVPDAAKSLPASDGAVRTEVANASASLLAGGGNSAPGQALTSSYLSFDLHPLLATDWDLFVKDPHGFSVSYISTNDRIKSLNFSDAVAREDIHFNSDTHGNLVVTLTVDGVTTTPFTVGGFEDGWAIYGYLFNLSGFDWGHTPAEFDGITEIAQPNDITGGQVFETGYSDETGTVLLYASIYSIWPVHYFLSDFKVGGHTYDLTHGVPIDGTAGDDKLYGFNINDITGQAYNDLINGYGGNDYIDGGLGNDTLNGGDGDDALWGGGGIDVFDGGAGNDVWRSLTRIESNAPFVFDAIAASTAKGTVMPDGTVIRNVERYDALYTGSGNDRVTFSVSINAQSYWDAGLGDDTWIVDGSAMTTTIYAGDFYGDYAIRQPGDYYLGFTLAAHDVEHAYITGGSGNDAFYGLDGDDVLSGGGGNDFISGRFGNDVLNGDDGNDDLRAVDGVLTVDGGAGTDVLTFDMSAETRDVVIDGIAASTQAGTTLVNGTTIRNVELLGWVNTGSGNDTFIMAVYQGAYDLWDAGSGNDLLIADASGMTTAIYATMANGNYQISGGYRNDYFGSNGVERVDITGGSSNDYLSAFDGADRLAGGAGNDALYGWGGRDSLSGGIGNDNIDGGDGNDTLAGDDGDDTVDGGEGDDDISGGIGNDTLTGGAGNDSLKGGDGDDRIDTGPGQDSIDGGAGNDVLFMDRSTASVGLSLDITLASTDAGIVLADGTSIRNIEDIRLLRTGSGDDSLRITSAQLTEWYAGGGSDTLIADYSSVTVDMRAENVGYYYITLDGGYHLQFTGYDIERVAISSGSGNDFLVGTVSDDLLNGGTGKDTLYGGAGNDTYYVDSAADFIVEDSDTGKDAVYASFSYTLGANLENLELVDGAGNINGTGNALGNWLVGNEGDNVLSGGDGSDILIGNGDYAGSTYLTTAGADTLLGGEGNDGLFGGGSAGHLATLDAGNGDDGVVSGAYSLLDGGAGSDLLTVILTDYGVTSGLGVTLDVSGVAGGGVVNLASGGQIRNFETFDITGTSFGDSLIDGNGNDILRGAEGSDRLEGRGGNDLLDGGAGADTLVGGLGDDTFVVDSAADVVTESNGQGTDTVLSSVTYALGATYIEVVTLTGTANIDAKGNTVNNALNGNAGNNRLDGGVGTDTLTGGLGDDTYVVDNAGDVVVELVGQGVDTLQTVLTTTLTAALANIENLVLTGTTNVNGTGNASDNSLTGNFGANSLTGLGGNDRLDGGGGADTLIGGLGNDTYTVDNAGDVVTELNGQGTDTVLSSVSFVLSNALSIETLTLTGPQHINATGNAFANALNGNSGNNTLNGGSGADTLVGGLGHDIYVVENVGDVVIEGVNAGTDTVQSAVTYVLGDNVENLTLAGSGAINGTGNDLANVIYGNAGANVLNGMGGVDKLYGRGGNDTYIIDTAGTGASELLGGTDAGGVDEVRASVSFNLGFYIENLILTGSGNIAGGGNDLANTITGNAGDNILKGRLGNDTLSGGLGADQFVFEASAGKDRVMDFSATQNDKINVHALAHGIVGGGGIALSQVGGDTVVDLGGGNMVTIVGALLADVQSHIVW